MRRVKTKEELELEMSIKEKRNLIKEIEKEILEDKNAIMEIRGFSIGSVVCIDNKKNGIIQGVDKGWLTLHAHILLLKKDNTHSKNVFSYSLDDLSKVADTYEEFLKMQGESNE